MWYDYDVLPRAEQLRIISGSAWAVVEYAAGLASPMHKGDGFIIAHHRLLLSGAFERFSRAALQPDHPVAWGQARAQPAPLAFGEPCVACTQSQRVG